MPYQISKDARKKECDSSQFQKSMPDQFYLMRFAGKSMPNEFQTGDDDGAGGKGISSVGFCVHGWRARSRSRSMSKLGGIYIDDH